jgi:hypothetical protein
MHLEADDRLPALAVLLPCAGHENASGMRRWWSLAC